MTPPEVRFAYHTREAIRAAAPASLVILPTGATEQHGPHLPTGTDAFAVGHIAVAAARAVVGTVPVLVAPSLPFGSSDHHLPFGGTLSVSSETYYLLVRDLTTSLIASGFRRILILNGHGGNQELIRLVARDLALTHPVAITAASYWEIARDALTGTDRLGHLPGHAGAFETSLVLALQPDSVREPRPHRDPAEIAALFPDNPQRTERHGFWTQIDGYTDSPDQATAADGQRDLDLIVAAVARLITSLAREPLGSSE